MNGALDSLEGALLIRLHLRGDTVRRVRIRSSRSLELTRLLIGRPMGQVASWMGNVFSVCAHAQSVCAARAVERAAGRVPSASQQGEREAWVLIESARELLMRCALTWPGELGIAQRPEWVRWACQHLQTASRTPLKTETLISVAQGLGALLQGQLLGMSCTRWRALEPKQLSQWQCRDDRHGAQVLRYLIAQGLAHVGREAVEPLPPLSLRALDARMRCTDAFDPGQPEWSGGAREVGSMARQYRRAPVQWMTSVYGSGLATRWIALLSDLAALPGQMEGLVDADGAPDRDSVSPAPGEGIARVETARGPLVHRVRIGGDTVSDYQLLAPTEWNFHPRGSMACGLRGENGDPASLCRRARLLAQAIDPCVRFEVELRKNG